MAHVLRKLLLPTLLPGLLLALTSFALPSAAVAAPAPGTAGPLVGTMCLASDYPRTRIVNVESCNSSRAGQHWTVSGESIFQTLSPGMCLTSDYPRTRIVNVEPCNPSGPRQHWTISGEQISMTLV